jgi:hypothetical protein
MASIMTADQCAKKENRVEVTLDKPSGDSLGANGNSETSVREAALELQTTDNLSTIKSSGHEIPSLKTEYTPNSDQSEINKIQDKSESHNRKPIPEESITTPSTSIKKKESSVIPVVE